jgi:hypothetical protein
MSFDDYHAKHFASLLHKFPDADIVNDALRKAWDRFEKTGDPEKLNRCYAETIAARDNARHRRDPETPTGAAGSEGAASIDPLEQVPARSEGLVPSLVRERFVAELRQRVIDFDSQRGAELLEHYLDPNASNETLAQKWGVPRKTVHREKAKLERWIVHEGQRHRLESLRGHYGSGSPSLIFLGVPLLAAEPVVNSGRLELKDGELRGWIAIEANLEQSTRLTAARWIALVGRGPEQAPLVSRPFELSHPKREPEKLEFHLEVPLTGIARPEEVSAASLLLLAVESGPSIQ